MWCIEKYIDIEILKFNSWGGIGGAIPRSGIRGTELRNQGPGQLTIYRRYPGAVVELCRCKRQIAE